MDRTTGQMSQLVSGELAQLAASISAGSDAYLVLLSPEQRSLMLAINNGQPLSEISKRLDIPEDELRAAATESVQVLALYASALRRERLKATRGE